MSIIKWVALALIIRAATVSGPKVRFAGPTLAFLVVWLWFLLSSVFSISWDYSAPYLEQFSKMAVAVILITGLVRTRKQLKWLIVLLAWCSGFYALKLGVFFIRTGGEVTTAGQVLGFDNNDLAMFLVMGIPVLVFGMCEVQSRWGRRMMYLAAIMAVPAVLSTTSRGGMLAMAIAVGLTLWLKTSWWKAAACGLAILAVIPFITPEASKERYETIQEYEKDASAMGRLRAWRACVRMANDHPLLGVGFGQKAYLEQYELKYKDLNDPEDLARAAHSVWFSLLGETGYVGLGIYLAMIVVVVRNCRRVMKLEPPPGVPRRKYWAWNYAAGLFVATVSFAIAGTFLSQARFEYAFALYMASVPLAVIAREEVESRLKPPPVDAGDEKLPKTSAAPQAAV
jgi:probable O-glycosylation ligase (exosortase A-associated)